MFSPPQHSQAGKPQLPAAAAAKPKLRQSQLSGFAPVPQGLGKFFRQDVGAPAVGQADQADGQVHPGGQDRGAALLQVGHQVQGSVHRPPAGGDDIYHPHGSAQQVYGGGDLFVFAVQVDAQLHLGGTLAVQQQAIRRQLQRAALPGGSSLPLQVEAPLAKGHPGRPVAVHQNPHLGLHGGAGGVAAFQLGHRASNSGIGMGALV